MLNAHTDRQIEICSTWTKSFIWCTELHVASNVYSPAFYEDISELRHTKDTPLQLHICSHCSFSRFSVIYVLFPVQKISNEVILQCLIATPLSNCCVQHKNVLIFPGFPKILSLPQTNYNRWWLVHRWFNIFASLIAFHLTECESCNCGSGDKKVAICVSDRLVCDS